MSLKMGTGCSSEAFVKSYTVSYFKRLLPGIEYRFLVLPARSVVIKSTNLSQSIARMYSEKNSLYILEQKYSL